MTPEQIEQVVLTKPLSVKEFNDIIEPYELENGKDSRDNLEMRLKMAIFTKLLGDTPTIKFSKYQL